MHHWTKFVGGILLVAGTTIGAAMLALPVSMGMAGFIPSLLLFIAFWAFMTYTALLFLEVNTWTGQRTNIITMATETLGRTGTVICWSAYLFLLYALMTAYIAGSASSINEMLTKIADQPACGVVCIFPLLLLFTFFLIRGTVHLDYLNRFLMFGLVVSYFLMVFLLVPYIDVDMLSRTEWKYSLSAASIVATSFGFHIIIPSLYSYMHADIKLLKKTLIIGSIIPLLVYIVWQAIALGIIPVEGAFGLREGYLLGTNGAALLAPAVGSTFLSYTSILFSFFAIATSFIGVSLSLCDFLADGLKIKRTLSGNIFLSLLTFLPPLVIVLTNPRAFLTALEAAGAFGVVLLLGLMPALMVWSGRYRQKRPSIYLTPGGKPALALAILFSLIVIGLEIANKAGWLQKP